MRSPLRMPFRYLAVIILTTFLVGNACAQAASAGQRRDAYDGTRPKYIFLFIGDGFGLAQDEAAGAYLAAKEKSGVPVTLAMDNLPVWGIATTHAADRLITDSAAAGTALSTGHKTSCGTIGLDAGKTHPLKTVAERAHELGMRVGIVSTVPINHATPASFYSHAAGRFTYYEIGRQLSASGFEYFAGGSFINPDGDDAAPPSGQSNVGQIVSAGRNGRENCVTLAKEGGYLYLDRQEDFEKLKPGMGKVLVALPGAPGQALPYAIDRKPGEVTLVDFTRKGIELLDGPEGFFMMVEGGSIDWACHANDAATVVLDVIDFDNAVSAALEFYNRHPDETLIIVTSDHETGGMTLGSYPMHYESNFKALLPQKGSYDAFGAMMADYRKSHVGNALFSEAMAMARDFYGMGDKENGTDLTPEELAALMDAFRESMRDPDALSSKDKEVRETRYGPYDPFTFTICRTLATKVGMGWTTVAHTLCPVPVRAIGPSSALYGGHIDNTDIANNIFKVLDMGQATSAK